MDAAEFALERAVLRLVRRHVVLETEFSAGDERADRADALEKMEMTWNEELRTVPKPEFQNVVNHGMKPK